MVQQPRISGVGSAPGTEAPPVSLSDAYVPRPGLDRVLGSASPDGGGEATEATVGSGEGALDREQLSSCLFVLCGVSRLRMGRHPTSEVLEGSGEGRELCSAGGHGQIFAPCGAYRSAPLADSRLVAP